ncbi:hypothetical protein B0I35DRAFT_485278 [Stachybotrys elegans]|uniref:Uncharacterized protein n=1 Tax=Stachybotrys elegans TaxID=80388 RepID=A0A8K0S874_9HYPO|nr:hypothetical protein B0I35DRAFT_485278 [Stachybotrys elegans]
MGFFAHAIFAAQPGKLVYDHETVKCVVGKPEAPAPERFLEKLKLAFDQRPDTTNEQHRCIVITVIHPFQVWNGVCFGEPFFNTQRVVEGGIVRHCQLAVEAELGNIQDIVRHCHLAVEAELGNIQDIVHHCGQRWYEIDSAKAVLVRGQDLRHLESLVESGLIEAIDDRFGYEVGVQPGLPGGWQGDQFAPLCTYAVELVNIVASVVHCVFDEAVHHLNLAEGSDPQHKAGSGTIRAL